MNRRALLLGVAAGLGAQAFAVFGQAQNAGPWSDTLYCQFADEATARSVLASALSITIDPASPIPTGGGYVAIAAPIVEWVTWPTYGDDGHGNVVVTAAGTPQAGYWAMLKIRTDRDGYAATMTALAPYLKTLTSPANVFQ